MIISLMNASVEGVCACARTHRGQTITKANDAVILATAVEIRAHTLCTHDRDDFPVGETVDGVRVRAVELPPELRQSSLDDMFFEPGDD